MGSKLTYRLKKSLLCTAKGRPALRHREKQRAKPEIVRKSGLVSEVNKKAKMGGGGLGEGGLRILKKW